ncbi:membrane protein insertase YidC [Bacillus andreraoultii]|uniref:membrane protein insertase YidC n=1 Tax=Bacillus andreraoultii TaxID=1499685 RepID=UPI00053A869B|nr:membrane protein insertase YidC [Bacillus andreraoultii]
MKKSKTFLLSIVLIVSVFLLSGCAAAQTEGRAFHDYIVNPLIIVIKALGEFLGSSYGLAIIVITIILRTILLPIALNAAKKQKDMREKMEVMKPEMEAIQTRLKAAKTKEEQMKIQQEMMQLYQKHNFNPLNMGCLPILLQIPIWMGLYYAIRLSPEIAGHSFLWFNLGKTDWIIAILAGIAYFLQFRVSMSVMPQATTPGMSDQQQQQQQQMMKMMGIMSPAMILIASLSTPSALALYWTVSGFYLIGQTYLTRKLYPPVQPQPEKATANNSIGGKSGNQSNKKKKKKKK